MTLNPNFEFVLALWLGLPTLRAGPLFRASSFGFFKQYDKQNMMLIQLLTS